MSKIIKTFGLVVFVFVVGICVSTTAKAQSPADDPGIGGPGSPSVGVGSDGSPVVPFDGGMSLLLLVSGIGYAAKNARKTEVSL